MKKILIGLVAATSLVFGTGCGDDDKDSGSLCANYLTATQSAINKGMACGSDQMSNSERDARIASCEKAISSCSDADKKQIENGIKCLNKVNTCREGNELQYVGEMFTCAAQVKVSDACNNAFESEMGD